MPARAWLCLVGLLLAAASFAAESQPPKPPAMDDGPKAPPKKSEPTKAGAAKAPTKEMEHLDIWAEHGTYEGTNKRPEPQKADAKKPIATKEGATKNEATKAEPQKDTAQKPAATPPAGPGKFHFTGQVTVIRSTLRIDCEDMNGLVDPKTREVSRVIATGDVKILTIEAVTADNQGKPKTDAVAQDAWRGTCSIADYDVKSDRMEMTALPGKPRPRLWRDKGFGEADKILFFPNKGEYELIGDPVLRGDMPAGPSAPAEKEPPAK